MNTKHNRGQGAQKGNSNQRWGIVMKIVQRCGILAAGVLVLLLLFMGQINAWEASEERRESPSTSPEVTLSFPSLFAAPGDLITVTVTLSGATADVYSADIVVRYNASVVRAQEVQKGPLVRDWSMASNLGVDGEVRVGLAGVRPVRGNGELVSIVFRVIGAEGMSTDLVLARGDLNEGQIPVVLQNGRITVGGGTCYDLNQDGVVNETDVVLVVQHWRQHAGDPGWDARFDVNGDGIVNLLDVLKVASYTGKPCP